MTNTDKERADFEVWASNGFELHRHGGAEYSSSITQSAWAAWQARAGREAERAEAVTDAHPDDLAVDSFAAAMKAKLAQKRAEGRGGWWDDAYCNNAELSHMLREHVEKGDPLDVGNFAMMLHQRGERISEAAPDAELVQTSKDAEWLARASGSIAAMVDEWYAGNRANQSQRAIAADLILRRLERFQPNPEPSPDVEAENKQLRGTLEYIKAQSKNDYPGVLSVIRANASAALDRNWQKTVSEAIATLSKPEGK